MLMIYFNSLLIILQCNQESALLCLQKTNTHSALKHKICTEWVTAPCFSTNPGAAQGKLPPSTLLHCCFKNHQNLGCAVPIVLPAWFWERSPRYRCLPRAFSMAVILIFIPASFSSPTPHEGCHIASERPDSAFAALAAGLEPAAGCH